MVEAMAEVRGRDRRLDLKLGLDEINYVLSVLGARPYVEVFQLISNIEAQARQQLQPPPPPAD